MVPGRPPAGTNASALTRLCIVLRARMPSSLSQTWRMPFGPNWCVCVSFYISGLVAFQTPAKGGEGVANAPGMSAMMLFWHFSFVSLCL